MNSFCNSDSTFFVEQLITWFRITKRDLPWRQTYDPYHVWISEVMLQQTQMERGVRYFHRWINRFPSVDDVASAKEDDILVYWEGLGYYARARNLHRAAKDIVAKHSSCVPSDYETLILLPGIGPYTAAAVASIAGNHDIVVIDANVNRIFSRILDIDEPIKNSNSQKKVRKLAESLLPEGKARIFNQALMDFGGLVCTPKTPNCELCVIQKLCRAYANGVVNLRPILKAAPKTIFVNRLVGVIVDGGKIYMQKRKSSAVWGGLWEFPGGEAEVGSGKETALNLVTVVQKETGLEVSDDCFLVQVSHQYTNHKITLNAYTCIVKNGTASQSNPTNASTYRWMTPLEMDGSPCPSGIRKVIEHLKTTKPEMFSDNIA